MKERQPIHEHDILDDDARDAAAAYVLGLMDPGAEAAFELHVEGCAACRAEMHSLSTLSGILMLASPQVAPPAGLRERILQIPRSSHVVRSQEGGWRPLVDGVVLKQLDFDPEAQAKTFLCRIAPGAMVPPHHHTGPEQCFVVEGEAVIGGITFQAGDYIREAAGTDHEAVYTKTGCLLLLTTLRDAFLGI